MAARSDLGIGIRVLDYGETSRIGTIFTRGSGRLDVYARGARRPKSALVGGPHLLVLAEVEWYPSRSGTGLSTLTGYDMVETFRGIRERLDRIWSAWAILELLRGWIVPEAPEKGLFDLTVDTLATVAARGPGLHVLRFEIRGLALLGVGPELRRCVRCGATGSELAPGGTVGWSAREGGLLCAGCRPEVRGSRRVPHGAVRVLDALLRTPADRLGRLQAAPRLLETCRTLLDECHGELLGRRPRVSARRPEGRARTPVRS